VMEDAVAPLLLNILRHWQAKRAPGEAFQDFCARHGDAELNGMLEA
jgi:sulfite reductase beta subunit-like hemoprotein